MKMHGVSALLAAAEAQETRAETIQPHEFLNERGKKKKRTAPAGDRGSQGEKQYPLQTLLDEFPGADEQRDTAAPTEKAVLLDWREITSTEHREFQCHTPDQRLELRVGLTREKIMPNWWGVVLAGGQTRIIEKRYENLEQLQQRAEHWWAWEWDGEDVLSHQDIENIRAAITRRRDKENIIEMIDELDIQELLVTGKRQLREYREQRQKTNHPTPSAAQ